MEEIGPNPTPPDEDLLLPAVLSRRLKAMHAPPAGVPAAVDRRVLAGARGRIGGRSRAWRRVWSAGLAATAAAAVIAVGVRVAFRPVGPPPVQVVVTPPQHPTLPASPVRGDVDGDGTVDIVDAYVVARKLQLRQPLDPAWDVNGDGRVDQKDVDLIAGLAVRADSRSPQ